MSKTTTFVESHLRSAAKGISYRVLGTLATMLISYLMTGSASVAALIGGSEIAAKTALFWAHERVWNRIPWGRARAPLPPVEEPARPPAARADERRFALGASRTANRA